jgi:hypothetical protein
MREGKKQSENLKRNKDQEETCFEHEKHPADWTEK